MYLQVRSLLIEIHQSLICCPSPFPGCLDDLLKYETNTLSEISKDLKQECRELIPAKAAQSQLRLHYNQKFLTGLYCLRNYIAGKPYNQLTETEFLSWCYDVSGWYWKNYFSFVAVKGREDIVQEFAEKHRSENDPQLDFTTTIYEAQLIIRDLQAMIKESNKYRL